MPDIEKNVTIAAPIEKVWAALTDPEAIAGWMGGAVKVELKKGGRYKFFDEATTGRSPQSKNRRRSYTPGGRTSGKKSGRIQWCAGN